MLDCKQHAQLYEVYTARNEQTSWILFRVITTVSHFIEILVKPAGTPNTLHQDRKRNAHDRGQKQTQRANDIQGSRFTKVTV